MFKKIELENGLRIVTIPSKNTQAVTVLVLVKVGSKYESKEIGGISHFLEHMLFKGTKNRPTSLIIAEELDKVGGEYNAFTGEDYTGYYAKVEASNLDLALDWVSDIFLNSTLPGEEVKKEQSVIVEEINMYLDNPMARVQNLWSEVLYGDQPAGRDVAGTKESVRSISREDLVKFRNDFYTANQTLVCVAGKIDEEDTIEKIKEYFQDVDKSKEITKEDVVDEQEDYKSLIFNKDTDQTHLCLGVRGYNLFHEDKYVLKVLSTLLGGMMSSRLFVEVREKLGLAYYVGSMADLDPDVGCLMARAGVDNTKVDKAIEAILKEFKKLTVEEVKPEELQKAKDYIKGKMALSLESSDSLASFYSMQELLQGNIMDTKEIFEKINKVTKEDILRVSKDIFVKDKLNLALIGPFKQGEFDNLLKEF
jgi:predicted Zn-dependent peptidase